MKKRRAEKFSAAFAVALGIFLIVGLACTGDVIRASAASWIEKTISSASTIVAYSLLCVFYNASKEK